MSKFSKKARTGNGRGLKQSFKGRKSKKGNNIKPIINSGQQQTLPGSKKPNPFDLIFSKGQKQNTLKARGREPKAKQKRNSEEIRRKTLDVEFQRRYKANQIVDRRIGQKSVELSEEAKAEKRFLFQQKKLLEMKTAEDGQQSSQPNENEPIKRAYWRTMNKEEEEEVSDDEGNGDASEHHGRAEKRSRREAVAELVAQDRRLKAMRAMLRDEQEERVEQLDKSYRQLHKMGLLLSGKGAETMQNERISSDQEQNQKVVEESADPYDSMYHELQFQPVTSTTSVNPKPSSEKEKASEAISKMVTPKVKGTNKEDANASSQPSVDNANAPAKEKPSEESVRQVSTSSKIKMLNMLEPRFNDPSNPENTTNKNGKGKSAKENEKRWEKLARKERRGAIKELRKDARHLASLYADKQRKVRRERDEKTKKILQSLEVQESEYKKLRVVSGKRL